MKKPMDIEWAKDGRDGKLYIVQARPETVQSQRDYNIVEEYKLPTKRQAYYYWKISWRKK